MDNFDIGSYSQEGEDILLKRIFEYKNIHNGGINLIWENLNFTQAKTIEEINCLSTRGMFMNLNDFLSLKGFYPKILPHYFSDYEFTIRAYKKGFKLTTCHDISLNVDTSLTGIRKLNSGNLKFILTQLFSIKYVNNPYHYINFILLCAPNNLKIKLIELIIKNTFNTIKNLNFKKLSSKEILNMKNKYSQEFAYYSEIINNSTLPITIYGLNDFGKLIYETFRNKIKYIVDENKAGDFVENLRIIKIEELNDFNTLIIICVMNSNYLFEIRNKLINLNFTNYVDKINIIKNLKIYAGDIPNNIKYQDYLGLSLSKTNNNHIKWDLTNLPFPFKSNSIKRFQSEDVFEHIKYELLCEIFNEIYRILEPGGLFRLSLPDYNCDILYKRSIYDYFGNLVYDPFDGGTFENPSHLWFPIYDNVKNLIENTLFFTNGKIEYLHYYLNKNNFICHSIDYSNGYIQRTPDNDERVKNPYRPMSMVIDLYKDA